MSARFIRGSRDPVERLVRDAVLPEQEAQLGRMFLHVAQGDQLELQKAHRLFSEPGESDLVARLLVGQREQRGLALLAQLHQIDMEFFLGVGLVGRDTFWGAVIIHGEGSGGSEAFQGAGEIEVEPEEGVMGDRPEGSVARGRWVVGVVAPEVSSLLCAGTGEHGVLEHIDGRAELLPEGGPPYGLHRYVSSCHDDPLFL